MHTYLVRWIGCESARRRSVVEHWWLGEALEAA